MAVLDSIRPEKVFGHFEAITQIPHGSYNLEGIRNHLISFAEKNSIEYKADDAGNIILVPGGSVTNTYTVMDEWNKSNDNRQTFRALGSFYGLVAGFVETGETLEQCVHREVFEETGLRIRNVRYFGSQPWPYPCGLMVGFTADYAGGQIHVQREELKNVAWFHRDHLPKLPEKLSIARRLVDDWLLENEK